MKHKLQLLILLAIGLLQAIGFTAKAQDVTFDLIAPSPQTTSGVTVKYNYYAEGANIYSSGSINNELEISSSQSIACIKFTGVPKKAGKVIAKDANGTLKFRLNGTSMWEGNSNHIVFIAEDSSTEFCISEIRIWFVGSTYEPEPDNDDDDDTLIGTPLVRTSSVPVDGEAVKMAIVTLKQFSNLAQEYALWKTQQGYQVEEVYAEDYNNNGALTGEALAKAIQNHLKESRPAFVLIMGDYEHVPAFNGTKYYDKGSYVTDYFYGEYSGDYIPEAYVGRFSCYDADDIRAQMEKTKYMAKLCAADGQWLNSSIGLHNPADDIPTVEGYGYTMDYLRKCNVTVRETDASSSNVNTWINEGAATLTYFGHSLVTGFNGASYNIEKARQLSNEGRYPLMIGMTCLTGKFDNGGPWRDVLCLAEQMQRMPKAGSVAFIGATRESGAISNIYFMKGGLKDGQSYLGFMASMFPLSEKDPLNQHARTLGEGVAMGSFSVNAYAKTNAEESTEWWELFGDPTYQPYYTTPLTMKVTAPASAVAGHIINVKAAPKAVVCVSAGRTIAAVGLTDSEGNVALKLAKASSAGTYTLYCSAPNYTDYESTITLAANDGQEDVVDGDGVPSDFDFDDFTHHKVLIEKYTGQGCQYCYNDDVILDNYITSFGYQNKIYEMRHYAFGDPTGPGYLRIPTLHNPLAATWGVRGFPNYLVDRGGNERFVNYEGYQKRASEIKNGNIVGSRLSKPCKVSLSLDGSTYDPKTRQLKVVVSGKLADGIPDPRLSIFITQNGFIGYQSSYGDSFEHNGVSRATITDLNGDALTPREDGVFQKTYTITLQDKYGSLIADADKMDVVAFVSSWDNYGYGTGYEKDCSDSEVYNTIDTNIAALPLKAQAPILPGSDSPIVPPTEPKEITFADGTAYNAATAVHYDKVTYTRDFTNTNWQALYVPFSIDCEKLEDEYEIARIYNFIDYDDNNDGKFDRTYLVVQKKTTGSTVANTPYLIRAKNTGKHTLVMTDKVLERAETGSVDCGSMDCDYTFYGTYTTVSDMFANGYYALSNGALNKAEDAGVKLKPQRWYMQITTRNGGYPSATHAKNIRILVDGEEDVEGIIANENKHAKDNTTYDLQGRKVKNSIRGVQILNGKKVIK